MPITIPDSRVVEITSGMQFFKPGSYSVPSFFAKRGKVLEARLPAIGFRQYEDEKAECPPRKPLVV
jgi:hypothetical protein